MAYSYDELQGSGEPKDTETKVQLAGDVVPLPMNPGGDVSKTGAAGKDSDFKARIDSADKTNLNLMPLKTFVGYQVSKSLRSK